MLTSSSQEHKMPTCSSTSHSTSDAKPQAVKQRMVICSKDGSKTAKIIHNVIINQAAPVSTTTQPTADPVQPCPVTNELKSKSKKKTKTSLSQSIPSSMPDATSIEKSNATTLAFVQNALKDSLIKETISHHEHHDECCADDYDQDDDLLYGDMTTATGSNESKKKKKKKKKSTKADMPSSHPSLDETPNPHHPTIWYKSDAEEKQRIREFWLALGEEDRKQLVKLEKEAVLKKMKEQQKQTCSCSVCGRKRSVIEEELEILYDAYYDELECFANDQHCLTSPPPAPGYIPPPPMLDLDDQDDESDEGSMFEFGNSLTVKGGILTVADDFLKNDGRKFLDLMEQLAERKMKQLDGDEDDDSSNDWNPDFDEDEHYDEDDDEDDDSLTEEQRMEEGRRMFQIFAAKMFEQRVLTAYREKVAAERQMQLLHELEEEERQKTIREEQRQKSKEKKKMQKKLQKQHKEEERLQKEREKQAELERIRFEKEQKLQEEKKRREQERLKREEAERKKKELEHLKREEEKKKQRELEEKRRIEKEKKQKEEQAKKAKEAAEKKQEKASKERKRKEEAQIAAERMASSASQESSVNVSMQSMSLSEPELTHPPGGTSLLHMLLPNMVPSTIEPQPMPYIPHYSQPISALDPSILISSTLAPPVHPQGPTIPPSLPMPPGLHSPLVPEAFSTTHRPSIPAPHSLPPGLTIDPSMMARSDIPTPSHIPSATAPLFSPNALPGFGLSDFTRSADDLRTASPMGMIGLSPTLDPHSPALGSSIAKPMHRPAPIQRPKRNDSIGDNPLLNTSHTLGSRFLGGEILTQDKPLVPAPSSAWSRGGLGNSSDALLSSNSTSYFDPLPGSGIWGASGSSFSPTTPGTPLHVAPLHNTLPLPSDGLVQHKSNLVDVSSHLWGDSRHQSFLSMLSNE